jgi:hypothetical protein
MKRIVLVVVLLGACNKTPVENKPTVASAPRAAPGGGALTDAEGKPVEIASLYQGRCAVITFYRGFF